MPKSPLMKLLAAAGHSRPDRSPVSGCCALLQGWKLFAEAHRVQAGDQVSFELVSPHRMIVQVIRPVEAASPSNSPPDMREGSPQKSAKQTETSSPGGAGPPGLCHEEARPLIQPCLNSGCR